MPLSPMLTTGHFDPPTGSTYAVIKVTQSGQVTGWGWTETTGNPNLRQEYWVLSGSFVSPITTQAAFTFDSSGFPGAGGPPTTRAAFFQRLQAAWGQQQGVQTCAGPATAMAALPSGAQMIEMQELASASLRVQGDNVLQLWEGTVEIWSSQGLVGYAFTSPGTRVESLVSATGQVGPGLPLTLKPCQTQYASSAAYFAAMTTFLQSNGPPQRYESIANTWYQGVYSM